MQEKSFAPTIERLEKETKLIKGKQFDFIKIDNVGVDFSPYSLIVFCGYDHITLANIHMALHEGKNIILFDEPGKSLERELNSVMFLGMDSGRISSDFFKLITHCWSYRDVLGFIKAVPDLEPRLAETTAPDVPGARSVENPRNPPAPKRVGATKASQTPTP